MTTPQDENKQPEKELVGLPEYNKYPIVLYSDLALSIDPDGIEQYGKDCYRAGQLHPTQSVINNAKFEELKHILGFDWLPSHIRRHIESRIKELEGKK